jgi:hypothetical protein
MDLAFFYFSKITFEIRCAPQPLPQRVLNAKLCSSFVADFLKLQVNNNCEMIY